MVRLLLFRFYSSLIEPQCNQGPPAEEGQGEQQQVPHSHLPFGRSFIVFVYRERRLAPDSFEFLIRKRIRFK